MFSGSALLRRHLQTVMVSSYDHNCHDLHWLHIQNNTQETGEIYRWKTTEPTWELRLDMCWFNPFFHNAVWLTSLKKSSEVNISHKFKLFFLFYSSAMSSVQWWLSVQKESKICAFCIVSMQFVFSFLVFFVLLLTGTFNTEPLLILRRRC